MIIRSFWVNGLAHLSYLVCSGDSCLVIDPERRVQRYIDAAGQFKGHITHILETHVHADFVSGHVDLAQSTGALTYAPQAAECQYDHVPIRDGDELAIGDIILRARETPGHTPGHICYVLYDATRSQDDPAAVFTGDCLFVGDVGRPDLFPQQQDELAHQLYESLKNQLLTLPDYVDMYPAHGAGTLCGRSLAARRSSTMGYERKHNAELAHSSPQELANSLLRNMPTAPPFFTRCSEINRRGPAAVENLNVARGLEPGQARSAIEQGALVVDVRTFESYCGAHVPKSISLDLRGNAHLFAGWLVPPDQPLLLVAANEEQRQSALWILRRVGLDNVIGWLRDGVTAWAALGNSIRHTELVSANTLYNLVSGQKPLNLVDVRSAAEFRDTAIEGAQNIPVPALMRRSAELDRGITTVAICRTGTRAAMGASLLERAGFTDLSVVSGGMSGYSAAGYSPKCTVCTIPHGPRIKR